MVHTFCIFSGAPPQHPYLAGQHLQHRQKGSPAAALPEEAKEAGAEHQHPQLLLQRVVDSILTLCISVCGIVAAQWQRYRHCNCSIPSLSDVHTGRCRDRAVCIMKDPPTLHRDYLPDAGWKLHSIQAMTTRLMNKFFPDVVRLLNCLPLPGLEITALQLLHFLRLSCCYLSAAVFSA